MIVKKGNLISVSKDDDFLYSYLIKLLEQIKLVQSGTALDSTLKRHSFIRNYLISKQKDRLDYIETTFFNEDGTLSKISVSDQMIKNRTLQNNS